MASPYTRLIEFPPLNYSERLRVENLIEVYTLP